jgi:phosphotransferase system HPr (HPr) family protein
VADPDGVHARPAALLARAAVRWPDTALTLGRPGGDAVAASDVLRLLGLGLRQGETVEIVGRGTGSEDAVAAVADMIDAGLD